MICHNCAIKLEPGARYCGVCGYKTMNTNHSTPESRDPVSSGAFGKSFILKKNILLISIVVVILTTVVVAVVTFDVFDPSEQQIKLGYKLLSEGKYEEAILAFNKAILINEKPIDSRIGLVRVYFEMNDFHRALSILEELSNNIYYHDDIRNNTHYIALINAVEDAIPGEKFELLNGKFMPFNAAVLNSGFRGRALRYSGSETWKTVFDLHGNGDDEISLTYNYQPEEHGALVTLRVNSSIFKLELDYFGGADIIDFDKTDDYSEIAIYDVGPSEDPLIHMIRYNGMELFDIGPVPAGWKDSTIAWLDQRGRIIGRDQYVDFTSPKIAMAYYQLEGNELIEYDNDYSLAYGKRYEFSSQFEPSVFGPHFIEKSLMPDDDFEPWMEFSYSIDRQPFRFNNGEGFRLIKAFSPNSLDGNVSWLFNRGSWYYIELTDGRRGILYFFGSD